MKIVKSFNCEQCSAEGKIILKNSGDTFRLQDVVYCPLCSGDIYEDLDEEIE